MVLYIARHGESLGNTGEVHIRYWSKDIHDCRPRNFVWHSSKCDLWGYLLDNADTITKSAPKYSVPISIILLLQMRL